jgi:hypothetical protein
MWADMATAGLTADYQSPQLAEHATGNALSLLSRSLYTDKRQGLVVKGTQAMNPRALSALPTGAPTTVTLSDCLDDRKWLNYRKNGALENNVPGGLHYTTATVIEMRGEWKVSVVLIRGVGTC